MRNRSSTLVFYINKESIFYTSRYRKVFCAVGWRCKFIQNKITILKMLNKKNKRAVWLFQFIITSFFWAKLRKSPTDCWLYSVYVLTSFSRLLTSGCFFLEFKSHTTLPVLESKKIITFVVYKHFISKSYYVSILYWHCRAIFKTF